MQTLHYAQSNPRDEAKASDMPMGAGNNWDDPAFKGGYYGRKDVFGFDNTKEPGPTMYGKIKGPSSNPGLATSLADVYQRINEGINSPRWLTLDDKAMRFYAYFRETVVESPETDHIRKVHIVYFPNDATLMIGEPTVGNSGIQGGNVLKRHRVALSNDSKQKKAAVAIAQSNSLSPTRIATAEMIGDKYITMNDLNVGEEINIYGRVYYIVDCDAATREFMNSLGVEVPEGQPFPDDPYFSQYRSKFDGTSSRRHMTSDDIDLKMSMEMQYQGRTTLHHPEEVVKCKKFLADDRFVLMFKAIWEDRDNPHGDLRTFEVRFFLCDDTIEVIERLKHNCGRDPSRAFAFRRRLPRTKECDAHSYDLTFSKSNGPAGSLDNTNFYGPDDLYIGACINVYGRSLRLVDCDKFTRDYFRDEMGVELHAPINYEKDYGMLPKQLAPNYPPPHNHYGGEEDSLGNWKNLVLKPPKQDLKKWLDNDGKLLRFCGQYFRPPTAEDADRKFMFIFYLQDDTIQITEVCGHNTGMTGGRFLKRQKVKKFKGEGERCIYKWTDFYVGNLINVNGHVLVLTETDEFTRRWRYSQEQLPPGINAHTVVESLERWGGYQECSGMTLGDIIKSVKDENLDSHTQEVVDLMGRYDADHGGGVLVKEFVQGISGDPQLALPDTEMDGSESPGMAAAKNQRRQQIHAYAGLEKLRQEMLRRELTYNQLFKMIVVLPLSKADLAGSNTSNSIHMVINPYQLFSACRDIFRVGLTDLEVECMTAEFFPGPRKVMAQADWNTLMTKVAHFGGLPPLRAKTVSR